MAKDAAAMAQGTISSKDNRWLKAFREALAGSRPKDGDPLGVEGLKLVQDALGSGLEAEALLISEAGERDLPQVLEAAGRSQAGIARGRIFRTSNKLFAGVTGTEAPQGVAALFRQPVWGLEHLLRGSGPALIVAMVGVQDPGNVGTIVRSAEAFGATGAIATRGTADPWSPKALRASTGSALRLPLLRGMAATVVLAQLRISKVSIVTAAAESGARTKDRAALEEFLRGPAAIFVGSEGAGLPAEVEHAADARISIPMSEAVESLNAGVAAAIVLYEAAKIRASQPQAPQVKAAQQK
jgi:TrmH family RNA methyltransferase